MTFEAALRPVTKLGRGTVGVVAGLGYAGFLLLESLYFAFWGWRRGQPVRPAAVFEQMRQVGVDAIVRDPAGVTPVHRACRAQGDAVAVFDRDAQAGVACQHGRRDRNSDPHSNTTSRDA